MDELLNRSETASPAQVASDGEPTGSPPLARRAVRVLLQAVDRKDPSSRRHSERVAHTAVLLAGLLDWDRDSVERLREAALLHDVGKLGVRGSVLFKPGHLTDAERVEVQAHAARGARIVAQALSPEQASWIRAHHERWDGRGYPDGLAGSGIPEGARILAVADAWDVMTSRRRYSPPRSAADALAECERHSGAQFWPPAVAALHRAHRLVPLGSRPPAVPRAARPRVHAPASPAVLG